MADQESIAVLKSIMSTLTVVTWALVDCSSRSPRSSGPEHRRSLLQRSACSWVLQPFLDCSKRIGWTKPTTFLVWTFPSLEQPRRHPNVSIWAGFLWVAEATTRPVQMDYLITPVEFLPFLSFSSLLFPFWSSLFQMVVCTLLGMIHAYCMYH